MPLVCFDPRENHILMFFFLAFGSCFFDSVKITKVREQGTVHRFFKFNYILSTSKSNLLNSVIF